MMARLAALVVVMALVAMGGFGIGSPGARAQAPQVLKVGVPGPMQLPVGQGITYGLTLAAGEINAAGGIMGRRITVVPEDEAETPEVGIAAMRKLVESDKVDVMIGGQTSGVVLAQLPQIARAKTVYLGVGAASPLITDRVKKDYANFKYLFRVTPLNSTYLGYALADFVDEFVKPELRVTKIAIVGENLVWVQGVLPAMERRIGEKQGLQVVYKELFDVRTTDFSPVFAKARAAGAQFIVPLMSHASSDVVVKAYASLKVPIPWGGIDVKQQESDACEKLGGASVGEVVLFGTPPLKVAVTSKSIPFLEKYTDRFKRAPVYTSYGAYDALYIYKAAVEKAHAFDPEKVIPFLEKTDYIGASGRVVFDEAHDLRYGPGYAVETMVQWQDGCKRALIWPKQLTTGKFVALPWMR
jgi:branched-chain amino acid transport system substrate-binding protein